MGQAFTSMVCWFFNNSSKTIQRAKRIVLSTNGAGATRKPHERDWLWAPASHHILKKKPQNLKIDQRAKLGPKTIKLLEENIRVNLCDLRLGNSFLDMTPKAHVIKEILNKHDKIKIKSF